MPLQFLSMIIIHNDYFKSGFDEKKILKSFVADITKPETMSLDIFNGVNCVIHAAAQTGFSHFPSAEIMEEVNVNGICMVFE